MKIKHLHQILLCSLAGIICNGIMAQTFTKITEGPLVNDGSESVSCAWGDYDGDGDEDLFVSNGVNISNDNLLFRNEGSGNDFEFTQISEGDVGTSAYASRACSWGDYDNDGDIDLFVANQRDLGYNSMYQNLGDGIFTRVVDGSVVTEWESADPAGWIDYDNDGFLDVFVGNPGNPNTLYHSNRDGTFSRIEGNGIATDGNTGRSYWGDYDNDGDQDLLVGYFQQSTGALFENNGNGNFTRKKKGLILDDLDEQIKDGVWVDYDNDGDWDIANLGSSFYRNEGPDSNYLFRKVYTGIEDDNNLWSIGNWADIDNDGDIDCFVTNLQDSNFMYLNNADGTFTKVTEGDIVTDDLSSAGSAWADYDNDGDMDLYVSNLDENNAFYRNDNNNGNSWVKIKLIGTVSNTAALGAIIRVKANTGVGPVWQMRAIEGQSTLFGQNSLIAHFGLGTATNIDSLIVLWPAGHDTVITNVAVDTLLMITEKYPDGFLKANFIADTVMGRGELRVQFTDTSKADPDNPVTAWSWDFNGDGVEDSNEQNPLYTFSNPDGEIFNVSLVIENASGTDTLIREDYINIYPMAGNLAPWGIATTSSMESLLFYAQKAIDGDPDSRWASSWNDGEWLKVELDSSYMLGRVVIHWENAYATEYYIRVSSDGADWNTWVYYTCIGDGGVDTIKFTGIEAKYVMVDCIQRATQWGNSIYELEIFKYDGIDYGYPWICPDGIEDKKAEDEIIRIYPNPVLQSAQISYELYIRGKVSLEIFNCLGMKIQSLVNEVQYPGEYNMEWNTEGIMPGIYYCRFQANDNVRTQKMIVSH